MHDIELLVIWFLSVNTGVILTMLLPRLVSDLRGNIITRDGDTHRPVSQRVHTQEAVLVPISSRSMGQSHGTNERGTPGPAQAA